MIHLFDAATLFVGRYGDLDDNFGDLPDRELHFGHLASRMEADAIGVPTSRH
ncbi:conserved hypothetical protein [Burkholderia pseudomallei 576]|nr:conserved hypothetical protein [Burkholderia pseudomallei 576]